MRCILTSIIEVVICATQIVGFAAWHLHQSITKQRYSTIGKHLETQHGNNRTKADHHFKVLRNCNTKLDSSVYEESLLQADSILETFSYIFFFSMCFLPIGPANILCIVLHFKSFKTFVFYFLTYAEPQLLCINIFNDLPMAKTVAKITRDTLKRVVQKKE